MKVYVLWGLTVLLLFSCKETKQEIFLQQNQVSLAQPRIQSTNTMIDSFVTVTAHLDVEDVVIYYTSDGSLPTTSSIRYEVPIEVLEPKTYIFRAFHPNWKTSETASIRFHKKGQVPDDIIWYSKEKEQYKGQGKLTLINQKKAVLPFSNPQWVGFDSIVNAKVIFKKKTRIKSIDVGFLSDPQSWIFPPSEIIVYLNDSKKSSDRIIVKMDELTQMQPNELKTKKIEINREVNSIRLEVINVQSIPIWHDGSGTKAWLFMDEWIFN